MSKAVGPIVVVGAGPVGLFTALLLAQASVKVIVYEKGSGIDQSPRAVVYFPAVLEEFFKAGILEDIINAGEKNTKGCDWRDKDGNILCKLDVPPDMPDFAVMLSQPEMCEVVLAALQKTGFADVRFGHSFEHLEQDEDAVNYWIKDESTQQVTKNRCQYLIGADGGRSTVRKSLGIEMEGFTWDSWLFVAVNFAYNLDYFGWKAGNFIVDPDEWSIVVKRGKGDSWRMATAIPRQISESTDKRFVLEEAEVKRIKDRICRLLPGDTSKIEYEAMAPYLTHQRCASRFRQSNVLLAGDAAHLNNPVGGLGLTTGMLDAAHLGRSLRQIFREGANPSVLTTYARVRRNIFRERTDKLTTSNLLRLMSTDAADVKKREELFARLKDPREFVSKIQTGLPDFALTSTSETKFDTFHETTWFISVTQPDDWTREQFIHEYKTVHAGMTKGGKQAGSPVRRYVQLSNSALTVPGTERPTWDFVTCLTFPNLFITHAGLQDPHYRATAGKHIFCRLDQKGCLVRKVAHFSQVAGEDGFNPGAIRALMFHHRTAKDDEFTEEWFQERANKVTELITPDHRVHSFVLWQDITPKQVGHFFKDTQFAAGTWHNFKAVETYDFVDQDGASSFLRGLGEHLTKAHDGKITVVVGEPDVIF